MSHLVRLLPLWAARDDRDMGIRQAVILVGVLAGACTSGRGTGNGAEAPDARAGTGGAGRGGGTTAEPMRIAADGGGGGEAIKPPAAGGDGMAGSGAGSGEAGSPAAGVGSGGAGWPVAGSSGDGGAGGAVAAQGGTGGTPAPAERVLWSQTWTVAIHAASAYGGYKDATMGLAFDAGTGCRFGFNGSPTGAAQEFPTDGKCITAASTKSGSAFVYDAQGMNPNGGGGSAPIVGWAEAVSGKTVLRLRRTQTYTIQLLGTGNTSWNYADFSGTWEAIGY